MNKITRTYECNRDMTCPYCGQEIHVGDSVGLVDESVVLNTKYRLILFGVKQTDTVKKYSVYGCYSCCRKRNLFDTIVAYFMGVVLLSWMVFCIITGMPIVITVLLMAVIMIIIAVPIFLIRWILKIKKASYEHAYECHALV